MSLEKLKKKMAETKPKMDGLVSEKGGSSLARATVRTAIPRHPVPMATRAIHKVMRKAAVLADLMTGEDLHNDIRVVREAKKAMCRFFDTAQKKFVEVPDHKTRLAAVQFSRAYAEGLPVARQLTLTRELGGIEEVLGQLRASPEAMRALEQLREAGLDVPAVESQTGD